MKAFLEAPKEIFGILPRVTPDLKDLENKRLTGLARPLGNKYLAKQVRNFRLIYEHNFEDVEKQFNLYVDRLIRIDKTFSPLFSSYDKEIILPATCALGFIPEHHADLDEKGMLGRRQTFTYPALLAAVVVDHYVQLVRKVKNEPFHLSLPRGKNPGWPLLKSGRNRDIADVLLAIQAALALYGRSTTNRLSDVTTRLQMVHGQAFSAAASRHQHKEGALPIFINNQKMASYNFEYRVRGIYMSPKYMVAFNRHNVKILLGAVLNSPFHTQDRDALSRRFSEMESKGFSIHALDHSKFDQSHGGAVGQQLCRMCAQILARAGVDEEQLIFENFKHEFSLPMLVHDRYGTYLSKGGEILSSGISLTTIANCLGSHMIVLYLASALMKKPFSIAAQEYGKSWDAVTWGDDMIFAIHKRYVPENWESWLDAFTHQALDATITEEPTVKFLGQNYNMRSFKDASTGYPLGRFVQQQFFPERKKEYPFTTIGYIARLKLMDQAAAKAVHTKMREFFDELDLGPFFEFQAADSVLNSLLPVVEQKANEIAQLDDVLNVFNHGIDDQEISFLPDEFNDLLALSSINMDDPAKTIAEEVKSFSKRGVSLVNKLAHGDFSVYMDILREVNAAYGGLSVSPGEVYY